MKIELDYDPSDGSITVPNGGQHIAYWTGLEHCEAGRTLSAIAEPIKPSNTVSVSELKELKDAGFTAHEIAELRSSGVL